MFVYVAFEIQLLPSLATSSLEEQAELIWKHIGTILRSARMDSDLYYDKANVKILMKYLGSHAPARTVFCCQLPEKKWKLEIEAVAESSKKATSYNKGFRGGFYKKCHHGAQGRII